MATADKTKTAAEEGRATGKDGKMPRSLRISPELDAKLADASERSGLNKGDVMRMAMERGLGVLLEQLGVEKPAA